MKRLFLLSTLFIFIPLTFAFPLNSSTYSVESTTNSQSGGVGDSTTYSARFTSTAFQETGKGGSPFSATVGFFFTSLPDLIPFVLNFSASNPDEDENITIFALIGNQGNKDAKKNFNVSFYDGNSTNATFIGAVEIKKLKKKTNTTVNASWIASPVGPHNMTVVVDPAHIIIESNETNNNLSVLLHVKALAVYYGFTSGNLTLATSTNKSEYKWQAVDSGNVYFVNSNATINFNNLVALGRNTTGAPVSNDFAEADSGLRMVNFNDSIERMWAVNASTPKQTANFTVFGSKIQFVPVINSTNNSNFITGILWDSTNDADGQFSGNETLVFVSNINRNKSGLFGTYDYEIKIPVLLRVYDSPTNQLKYFLELR